MDPGGFAVPIIWVTVSEHYSQVRYACTCGELKPISRIYFCRHCSKIRCGFCVCHEVDARYCAVCVDNIPAAEAWMKGNCCSRCFTCPLCNHNLITKITSNQSKKKDKPEGGDKEDNKSGEKADPPKKYYYLNCFFCHWTSRDVDVPDQITSSGNWPESENPNNARINTLIEYYKALSINDRLLKERKQPSPRRAYSHLSGMTASMALRKAGLPPYSKSALGFPSLQELRKIPEITPALPLVDVNDLPEDIFTSVPDLSKVTTLEQRFKVPYLQCEDTSKLKLCRSLLLTKRSQRCRECDHNVTKPEFNPVSVKFKMQLSAYFHIPDIRLKSSEPLHPGKESNVILKISNPTRHCTTIKFLPLTENDLIPPLNVEDTKSVNETVAKDVSLFTSKKSPFMKVEPRKVNVNLTGTPVLPSSIVLPGRDDAAEYDDVSENESVNDDKKFIIWKKGNRACVILSVRPNEDLKSDSEVNFGFIMSHTYVNTIIQEKDLQKITHDVRIIINLGKIS